MRYLETFTQIVDARSDRITPLMSDLESLYGLSTGPAMTGEAARSAIFRKIATAFAAGHPQILHRLS